MKLERVKIKWPVALNTVDNKRVLLPNECPENYNLIVLPDGSVRAHYNWAGLELNDTTKIIWGTEFNPENYPAQTIVFGVKSDGGFLGKIIIGETTLEILRSGLSKISVPCFVKYKQYLYIFMGALSDTEDKTLRYDGETLENSNVQAAFVGCEFRGRLWFADKGILKFTNVGTETVGALNDIPIGNIDEVITNLIPLPNSIVHGKGNEVWELTYTTLKSTEQYASDAKLKCRTKKAGMMSHRTACRHFNTIYFYDDKGSYILNPGRISINPDQLLEIDPGIVKISKPVRNIFESFDILRSIETTYEKKDESDVGVGDWNLGVFDSYSNIRIGLDSNSYDLTEEERYGVSCNFTAPLSTGWAITKVISLPEGRNWFKIFGEGAGYYSTADITQIYLSKTGTDDWRSIPYTITGVGQQGFYQKWEFRLWNDFRDASTLYIKFTFRLAYTQDLTPYIWSIKLTTETRRPYFGSGFHKDRFYIFAEDQNGDRVNLMFKDGWKRPQNDGYEIYNLCNEVAWTEEYSIIGFGENSESLEGSLIKNPIPEDTSGNMTVIGETGNIDYDKADVPKKLRRIFITYKGTGTNNLKIYREDDDLIKSIDLPAKTDFGIEEIGIQSDRSKWHRYKITSTKADFALKSLDADVKTFKPQEV